MPRLRGSGKHAVHYRHVIHSLVRKPGAFPHYRYQQDMFPRLLFRVAYDWLREHSSTTADRQYLKILQMAALNSEDRIHDALRYLIDQNLPITVDTVRERIDAQYPVQSPWQVRIAPPQVRLYDELLAPVPEAECL